MAKTYVFRGSQGLNGGLNVSDDPLIVGPNEMTVAKNVLISNSLSRRKRPGQEAYHLSSFASTASYPTLGEPIRGIIQYWRYASATGEVQEDLFLHSEDKVWSIASRTDPAIDRTGALVLSETGIPQYQIFEGILYFVSSQTADGYNKWNGLATTPGNAEAATAPPDGVGKLLGTYRGRMLMAGNPDFPFRLYVSASLDAEDWVSADATSLDLTYDGDPNGITAILPEKDGRVYIATRRSIYELSGDTLNSFIVKRITQGIGCVGQGTVVALPNDILFASDRGVHSLRKIAVSDQTEYAFQSEKIQLLWTTLLATNLLEQARATWDEVNNIYEITVPSSGQLENDTVLSYNIGYGHWTLWDGISARSINQVLLLNKQYVICGREDGNIVFLNPELTEDLDVGFVYQFKTGKFFPDDDVTSEHRFKAITILASTTSASAIQVNVYIEGKDGTRQINRSVSFGTEADLLGSTFILGQSTLGIGRFVPARISIEETGFCMQLEIISGGSSDINFLGWSVEVEGDNERFT